MIKQDLLILPMGGLGVRTQEFGDFKPLIEINGRTILSYHMESLEKSLNIQRYVIIAIVTDDKHKKQIRNILREYTSKYHVINIKKQTDNQLDTIRIGLTKYANHELHTSIDELLSKIDIVVSNPDQYHIFTPKGKYWVTINYNKMNGGDTVKLFDKNKNKSKSFEYDNVGTIRLSDKQHNTAFYSGTVKIPVELIKPIIKAKISKDANMLHLLTISNIELNIVLSKQKYSLGTKAQIDFFKKILNNGYEV